MEDKKFKFEDGKFVNRVSGEAIPDDEPVVIFRARDKHALKALLYYHMLIKDPHHRQAVEERINEFAKFQADHPERMKEPGISRDMVLNTAMAQMTGDPYFSEPES